VGSWKLEVGSGKLEVVGTFSAAIKKRGKKTEVGKESRKPGSVALDGIA